MPSIQPGLPSWLGWQKGKLAASMRGFHLDGEPNNWRP